MATMREVIMAKCPKEFEDDLVEWIDDIENHVNSVLSKMKIEGIEDLYKIEEARDHLAMLSETLY